MEQHAPITPALWGLDLRMPKRSHILAGSLPLLLLDGLSLLWVWILVYPQSPVVRLELIGFNTLTTMLILALLGGYRRNRPNLLKLWVGIFLAFALIPLVHLAGGFEQLNRASFFMAWGLALVLVPGARLLFSNIMQRLRGYGIGQVPVYLVCSAQRLPLLQQWLTTEEGFKMVGYDPEGKGHGEELVGKVLAAGAQEVLIDEEWAPEALLLLYQQLSSMGIGLRSLSRTRGWWGRRMPQFFQGRPILEFDRPALFQAHFWIKRAIDKLITALGLLLISPFLALVALLIKRDSPGPVFFTQTRVGVQGKLFKLYKFRSMYVDAEERKQELMNRNEGCGPLFKLKDDPRITPIGSWLRRYSLDELPQLINVLKGEMSLVGPRPALPAEVAQYSPWQRQRLLVLPGITGLWQVSGRSDIPDFEDAVQCDLLYIQRWSLNLDLEILWRTVGVVLKQKGAY